MASYQCYLVLVALSLFVFIQIATPLRCFVCTTKDDGPACDNPLKKIQVGNKTENVTTTALTADTCDLATAVCLKRITPGSELIMENVQRACVDPAYCELYKKSSTHCSICKTDQCNSSFIVTPSFSIIALLSGVYMIYVNIIMR